jgi:hypothetical protein
MKKILILFVIMILSAIITSPGCITDTEQKVQTYNIIWVNTQPSDYEYIETQLSSQITPYKGIEYDNVTISANEKDEVMHLHISATSPACRYPDLYEFEYNNQELTRTGYLLEAIPEKTRQDAIGIAMENPDIASSLSGDVGDPTVRRILPETSEKFYKAKTCLSITWEKILTSALVDMDTLSVVKMWNGEG